MSEKIPGRFLVAMGAVIEHQPTGRILLIHRSDQKDFTPGIWENITGRMHQFETPEEALRREIKEEVGLEDIKVIKPLNVFHIFRGQEIAENELVGVVFWCQTNTGSIKLSEEHSEYKWISAEEAVRFVSNPGVRGDIKAFIRERSHK